MLSVFDFEEWQKHGQDQNYGRKWQCPIAACDKSFHRPNKAFSHMLSEHADICQSRNIVAMRITVMKADNSPEYIPSSFYQASTPNKYFDHKHQQHMLDASKAGKRTATASSAGQKRQSCRRTAAPPAIAKKKPAKAAARSTSNKELSERIELKAQLKASDKVHAAEMRAAEVEAEAKLRVQEAQNEVKLVQMEKRAAIAEEQNKSKDALLQEREESVIAWRQAALTQPQSSDPARNLDAVQVFH